MSSVFVVLLFVCYEGLHSIKSDGIPHSAVPQRRFHHNCCTTFTITTNNVTKSNAFALLQFGTDLWKFHSMCLMLCSVQAKVTSVDHDDKGKLKCSANTSANIFLHLRTICAHASSSIPFSSSFFFLLFFFSLNFLLAGDKKMCFLTRI